MLLAKSVDAPHDVIQVCERVTKYYISAKYPVSIRVIPTEEDVESDIADVEGVLEWARSILK